MGRRAGAGHTSASVVMEPAASWLLLVPIGFWLLEPAASACGGVGVGVGGGAAAWGGRGTGQRLSAAAAHQGQGPRPRG